MERRKIKTIYNYPKGLRIKKGSQKTGTKRIPYYTGMTSRSDLWYCEELDKWLPYSEIPNTYTKCTSDLVHPIRSVKAAQRYLRKHTELKSGTKMTLVSNFQKLYINFIVK